MFTEKYVYLIRSNLYNKILNHYDAYFVNIENSHIFQKQYTKSNMTSTLNNMYRK